MNLSLYQSFFSNKSFDDLGKSWGLLYKLKRITRHPRLKYDMLFETGVWLAGFVIQGTGFTRLLKCRPRFFYCPVTSAGMVPVM